MTGISVFDVLGTPQTDLHKYTVRLSQSLDGGNIALEYVRDRDQLLDHAHTVRWAGGDRRNIPTPNVLQFIQLTPRSMSQWLFVGSSTLLGTERQTAAGNTVAEFALNERHEAFAGRLVARYTMRQGVTGAGALTHNLSRPRIREDFVERFRVDQIARSPISALPFPGYKELRLNHAELAAAVDNDEWKAALDSVSAIYLLTDRSNGWHYVGAAYSRYGENHGLLSRWTSYTRGDYSGGNLKLKELVRLKGKEHIKRNFEYTVLEIFDPSEQKKAIIHREHWWMDTLQSVWTSESPFGYNSVAQRVEP